LIGINACFLILLVREPHAEISTPFTTGICNSCNPLSVKLSNNASEIIEFSAPLSKVAITSLSPIFSLA
jgi:hypothetical protein